MFKELAFKVRGDLRPGLSGNDLEAFVDRLIDIVEARSLAFGGGAGRDDKLDRKDKTEASHTLP